MREVDFLKADLNLLVILRALLQTRSVGLTAERLGLSQPAVSRAWRGCGPSSAIGC